MQKIGFCDRYGLTQDVLQCRKTMTRRLEKGLENLEEGNFCYSKHHNGILLYGERGSVIETIKTRYKLGEVVAVAQSYSTILNELEDPHNFTCMEHWESASSKRAHYAELVDFPGWNNKLFVSPSEMIHQIQIMDVSIERLKAISYDDCLKEGVFDSNVGYNRFGFRDKHCDHNWYYTTPRAAFAALIERPGIGHKGLWESNPWVVVYTFKLIK